MNLLTPVVTEDGIEVRHHSVCLVILSADEADKLAGDLRCSAALMRRVKKVPTRPAGPELESRGRGL